MVYEVIKILLPIIAVLYLGHYGKKQKWINDSTIVTIKNLVGSFLLPVLIFNSNAQSVYDKKFLCTVFLSAMAYAFCMVIGFALKRAKINESHNKYMPFLITIGENGMIGYALANMLFENGVLSYVPIDIGSSLFFFPVFYPLLTIADGKASTLKDVVKRTATNLCFIALICGIITSLTPIKDILGVTDEKSIYTYFVSFVTAPTTFLILLMVGYSIDIREDLIKPVAVTVTLRFVIMQLAGMLLSAVLFKIIPYDEKLRYMIALAFAMPPALSLPAFAEMKGEEDYYSATVSVATLLTIAYFAVLVAIKSI